MRKQLTLFLLAVAISTCALAQVEGTAFSATGRGVATPVLSDYQTLGINPGNLGVDTSETRFALGFLEFTTSFFSDALTKVELRKEFLSGGSAFTLQEKTEAARQMIEKGLGLDLNIMAVGFGVNFDGMGAAFNAQTKVDGFFTLDSMLSNILFQGFNFTEYFDTVVVDQNGDTVGVSYNPLKVSEIFGNSVIASRMVDEYNIGFGATFFKTDNITLSGGIGYKLVKGLAVQDFRMKDGEFQAFAAMSPVFGVDFDSLEITVPSQVEGDGLKPVGTGHGFNFGVTAVLQEKLRLAVALTDVGAINWNGNLVSIKDVEVDSLDFSGFDSYNLYTELLEITGGELFDWQGEAEWKQSLPTKLRLGGYMSVTDKIGAGIDVILPVNDVAVNFKRPVIGIGGDFRPINQLRLSGGVVTGGYYGDISVPFGFGLLLGPWEMGLSTRDVTFFLSKKTPHLSLGAGLLRFKF